MAQKAPKEVRIYVLTHRDSGLKMARSADLPGFVVHANTFEELDEKIPAALRSFVKHTQGVDALWALSTDDVPAGFDPVAFTARRTMATPQAA